MVDVRRPTSRRRRSGPGSSGSRHTLFSLSEQETIEIGRTLGRGLHGGDLVLLEGELGLGKTVLAKGIAAGLGVDPDDVTSPSYTLVQEYEGGRVPLFHLDLYRLDMGRYPGTDDGLRALVEAPVESERWNGPYVKKANSLIDPWGKPYEYLSPGDHGEYDLFTLGADKQDGGDGEDADVTSW